MTLRVAVVAGPMYDHLLPFLDQRVGGHDVEVVVQADHGGLNAALAERIGGAGERFDLVSTHGKYAPSQHAWLRPLDDVVAPDVLTALSPAAVDLCRYEGRLLCVPRCIDVRVLWARTDRGADEAAVDTWSALAGSGLRFGFPGTGSGLFGTFFELVLGLGGRLFDDAGRPALDPGVAAEAVELLDVLAGRNPPEAVGWGYDDLDAALLAGEVDAAGCWPGAAASIRTSAVADVLQPFAYPAGPQRRVTYAGCHAWGIPTTCGEPEAAAALLAALAGAEAQALDARGGSYPAHLAVAQALVPVDATDARRLELTRRAIAEQMATYPALPAFDRLEDAGWRALHDVLVGACTQAAAVDRITAALEAGAG